MASTTKNLSKVDFFDNFLKVYDVKKKGYLTKKEVQEALTEVYDEDDLKEIFTKVDTSDDGKVTVEELGKYLKATGDVERAMRKLCKAFDKEKNNSGMISFNELRELLKMIHGVEKISEKEVEDVFDECDKNGDGFIKYHELYQRLFNQ